MTSAALRITCVGGGPAGLLFAILTAKAGHRVRVIERQEPEESFGWGVVFWDDLMRQLRAHDEPFAAMIEAHKYTWHDQVIQVDDQPAVRIDSLGYSLRRRQILQLLRERAAQVGVSIESGTVEASTAIETGLTDTDLIIAADGVNSRLRRYLPDFGSTQQRRRNKYLWLGTDAEFDSFTFPFVPTAHGWLWAHAYGFDRGASTFVVETTPETWAGHGFDTMNPADTMHRLEQIFADSLEGHRLEPQAGTINRTPWNEFTVITNQRWHTELGSTPIALMGDAAHTTHFTIGSGTRLAMEDAMALADALVIEPTLSEALTAYETKRRAELATTQRAATRSAQWFEQVPRYIERSVDDVARMMDDRRSPVMPLLPVGAYLALTHTVDRFPGVAAPLRKLVSKVMA